MSFAETYNSLTSQVTASKGLSLILGSKPANQQLALHRVTLTKDIAGEFSNIAKEAIPAANEIKLISYDPTYKPDSHEIMYIALSAQPPVKAIIDDLRAVQDIPLFEGDKSVTENLKLYAVAFGGNKEDRAVLLRATSERIELSKGAKLAAILRSGTFSKLKQKVFLFDRRVDCAAIGEFLFVINKANFERLFQYYEELRAHAAETVEQVGQYIPISNFGEFKTACTTQVRFMDKLASISRKPYLKSVTMADIKRVVVEFHLPLTFATENGQEKIVFENALDKRWQILKLLDDDYLESIMTDQKYAANSKIPV